MTYEDVSVHLGREDESPPGGCIVATWLEQDSARLAIAFPTSLAPVLPIGWIVPVGFRGGSLERPLEATGRVTFRHQDEEHHVYHLLFGAEARNTLGPLIEPREAIRVTPEGSESIVVRVTPAGGGQAVTCLLRDIGVTGLGLVVPAEREPTLAMVSRLHLSLTLGGEEVSLEGLVRNRGACDDGVQYGVRFIEPDNQSGKRDRHKIVAYVERRLRAMAHRGRPQGVQISEIFPPEG